LRDADRDGDGRISFEEFTQIVEIKNSDFISKWTIADI